MSNFKILSDDITKLTVFNVATGEEIAVISDNTLTTAALDIAIRLTPKYD